MLDRRAFLTSAAGLAATTLLPSELFAAQIPAPAPLPQSSLADSDPERYWAEIRKQFLIPASTTYLNNGTCGSSPLPVLKAVFDSYMNLEKLEDDDTEQYPLFGYGPFDQYRTPIAQFIGCTKDEIAILRNATEANAIMANGLDLKPGDEVLTTDQEHGSGNSPWNMRAKRYGIVIKRVTLPLPPKSPDEVLNLIGDAITPKTRVLFFSHITTVTGVVLPAKELCALARSKGIVSMVDGAQVIGMMPLNVREIGADLYGTSPHKWLMSPKGTGILYVRDEIIDRIWSNTTTAGWDETRTRAGRFQQYGSANIPVVAGMVAAIDFAKQIGLERIEKRQRASCEYLLQQMVSRGAQNWTSPHPQMRSAIATVNVPPIQRMELQNWMWKTHHIRIRGGEPSKLRLSTPYYVSKADMDRFLAAFDEFRQQKGIKVAWNHSDAHTAEGWA